MSFALKIAFSNFFWLRKKLLSILWPHILINLLSCTKQQNWCYLEALKKWFCAFKLLKWLFLQKSSKLMKICLLHCKNSSSSLERNIFHGAELCLLKLHLATFSDWERSFWASVASHSHHLLSCTNTELVFLEALKKWFLCI